MKKIIVLLVLLFSKVLFSAPGELIIINSSLSDSIKVKVYPKGVIFEAAVGV